MTSNNTKPGAVDMKLEVVAIPVSDIERAKRFYGSTLGWGVDADFTAGGVFPRGQGEHARDAVMFKNGIATYHLPETVQAPEAQVRVF